MTYLSQTFLQAGRNQRCSTRQFLLVLRLQCQKVTHIFDRSISSCLSLVKPLNEGGKSITLFNTGEENWCYRSTKQAHHPLGAAGPHPNGCWTVCRFGLECYQCLQGENKACCEQRSSELQATGSHNKSPQRKSEKL